MQKIRRKMYSLFLSLLFLLLFLLSCAVLEDLPPEPGDPGTITRGSTLAGQAASVFKEYAPPVTIRLEDLEGNLGGDNIGIVPGSQSDISVIIDKSEHICYIKGYVTDKNGQWRGYEFSGIRIGNSNWLQGKENLYGCGHGNIPVGLEEFKAGENYLVAYACTKIKGQWDCHGNKWMLKPFMITVISRSCQTNDDCPPELGFCEQGTGTCVSLPEEPTITSEKGLWCYYLDSNGKQLPTGTSWEQALASRYSGVSSSDGIFPLECRQTSSTPPGVLLGYGCGSLTASGPGSARSINNYPIAWCQGGCQNGVCVQPAYTYNPS